ncbi:MAG: c-type cytochrome [Rhodocyclaceae bacterium]|nr:c-type cytochrome [Rhodocyclaceae bacterium]
MIVRHSAHLLSLFMALAPSLGRAEGPLASFEPTLAPEMAAAIRSADLEAGARYFERKCSQCHDGAKDGGNFKGPHLWNVFGRVAGTHAGFRYSDAMKAVGKPWSFTTLDYYLSDTERAVPGREMNFAGITNPAERANLLAYLSTLADTPPPPP